jgi:alkaline phosphatase D
MFFRTRPGALPLLVAVALGPACLQAAPAEAPLRRIAFGSCAHQNRPQPIWEAVVKAKPDLFLFLGDNVYADTLDMKVLRAEYAKLAAVPGYKQLRKTCPVLATWDDHDYGLNDSGADYPMRRESQQVFLDFWGVPKDSPRRKQEGVYHAQVFGPPGQRVQVIQLDTRYFRSPLKKAERPNPRKGPYVPETDKETTILGEAQWKWLAEQLKVPAELRLLVSSIQVVAEDHGFEKWGNFPHERDRLLRTVREAKAAGVVLLSGDRHLAELSVLDRPAVGYPLFDLTSSGLNMANKSWRALEANRRRVALMDRGNNFGVVEIDWGRKDPLVRLQIRDEEGDLTIQEKVPLSRLRPRPAGANLAAEARKHLDKAWTVEFTVRATGSSRGGNLIFLNSERDFRSDGNFTVVLDAKALAEELKAAKIEEPAAHFKGKKVRVSGTVSLFNDRPQIMVKGLKQIKVVEE